VSLVSFISKRLAQNKNLASSNKVHVIVQIAVGSIAVSVIAMILSVFIVRGFQEEIRNKVILI
jgi:ABC-type lipoprotein release transport system permease subunit